MRRLWRAIVLGLGATHTIVAMGQQSMNADGIRYLEMGAAYWRGDWDMAINGIWSPLYGVLTGAVVELVDPPLQSLFPVVQIVNLLIFAAALAAFEFFWNELSGEYEERSAAWVGARIRPNLLWSLGYALFLWSSTNLIELWSVTPDMLVAAATYVVAGCILRSRRGAGLGAAVGLGVGLGVGYLAKAAMFPLAGAAFVILTVALGLREARRILLPAAAAFAFVAGPFVVTLSISEGHPTFSEVSRFTYLKHVNNVRYPAITEAVVERHGEPRDPPRRVHAAPDVWSYQGPVGGSYPPGYDPAYFTSGLSPRVTFREQLNAIAFNAAYFFRLFFRTHGAFTALALLVVVLSVGNQRWEGLHSGPWPLTAWGLTCFAMYVLVLAENRYVAPFVVLFWSGFLGYWRLGEGRLAERLSATVGILMVLALLADVAALNADGFAGVVGIRRPAEAAPSQFTDGPASRPPDVAEALAAEGIFPGMDIALVGYGIESTWAYLAGVRIVAEVLPDEHEELWRLSPEDEEGVMRTFADAGAAFVVAEAPPADVSPRAPWRPLGRVGFWYAPLR